MDIFVVSDAFIYHMWAVISHFFRDGSQKVIAYASISLTPAERKYSYIKKKALAVVVAIKRVHKMLYGGHFTLITDHKPFLRNFRSRKDITVYTENRLKKWASTQLDYNFIIQNNKW